MYMCEIRPFDLAPWTEVDPDIVIKTRTDMRDTTLETFGVPPGTRIPFVTGDVIFGSGSIIPRDGLWTKYLLGRDQPDKYGVPVFRHSRTYSRAVSGLGLAEPDRLLLPIVNLANAVPLLAVNQDRAYNTINLLQWRLVITALLTQLPTCVQLTEEVENVPRGLREKTLLKVGADASRVPFFQAGTLGSDLDLIFEYVAYLMQALAQNRFAQSRAGRALMNAHREKYAADFMQFHQATLKLEHLNPNYLHCSTM